MTTAALATNLDHQADLLLAIQDLQDELDIRDTEMNKAEASLLLALRPFSYMPWWLTMS